MNNITYLSNLLSLSKSKANKNELILEYYEMYVCEGIDAALHGNFSKITEIYIPELRIAINQAISPVNIFFVTNDRYKNTGKNMSGKNTKLVKTVTIDKKSEIAKSLLWLEDCLKNKKQKEQCLKQLFESEELNN